MMLETIKFLELLRSRRFQVLELSNNGLIGSNGHERLISPHRLHDLHLVAIADLLGMVVKTL